MFSVNFVKVGHQCIITIDFGNESSAEKALKQFKLRE